MLEVNRNQREKSEIFKVFKDYIYNDSDHYVTIIIIILNSQLSSRILKGTTDTGASKSNLLISHYQEIDILPYRLICSPVGNDLFLSHS